MTFNFFPHSSYFVGLCQFGKAHVDIPKGDLDFSSTLTDTSTLVLTNSQIYPYGTYEQFPNMMDTEGNVLANTAHEYVECSNKGYCDRFEGTCTCISGYEGSACHKTTCPTGPTGKKCFGHGTCVSIGRFAELDYDNKYELWDKDSSQACLCDSGFYGYSCNKKRCKYGYDPIYLLYENYPRFSNWSIVIFTKSAAATISGTYTITIYDVMDEDWTTSQISFGAPCGDLIDALEGLPNVAVPKGSVRCLMWSNYNSISSADEPVSAASASRYGIKYTLAFPLNPGKLKPPTISFFAYDTKPTLQASDASSISTFVYANGFSGQFIDYFYTRCMNVDVTLLKGTTFDSISGMTPFELRIFKQCLGGADLIESSFDETLNVQMNSFSWDYGTKFNPHVIKLVDLSSPAITDLCSARQNSRNVDSTSTVMCKDTAPPGFLVAFFYDPVFKRFQLLNRPAADFSAVTNFAVYTTNGVFQMASDQARVYTDPTWGNTDPDNPYSSSIYTTNSTTNYVANHYMGNIDCETNGINGNGAFLCLEKGDLVLVLDPNLNEYSYASNPKYLNLYEIKKISIKDISSGWDNPGPLGVPYSIKTPEIILDMPITSQWRKTGFDDARIYKFFPGDNADPNSYGYEYVSECSGRGECFDLRGECTCFVGYSSGDCSVLETLAV